MKNIGVWILLIIALGLGVFVLPYVVFSMLEDLVGNDNVILRVLAPFAVFGILQHRLVFALGIIIGWATYAVRQQTKKWIGVVGFATAVLLIMMSLWYSLSSEFVHGLYDIYGSPKF